MWRHEGGRKGVPVLLHPVVVLRGLRIKARSLNEKLKAKVEQAARSDQKGDCGVTKASSKQMIFPVCQYRQATTQEIFIKEDFQPSSMAQHSLQEERTEY